MTQDLTKITTPFGLLDEETKEALKEAYRNFKVVQQFTEDGWDDHHPYLHGWNDVLTYRIKPEPVIISTWTSVYPWGFGIPCCERKQVDENKDPDRICVLRIDWHDGDPSFHREEN